MTLASTDRLTKQYQPPHGPTAVREITLAVHESAGTHEWARREQSGVVCDSGATPGAIRVFAVIRGQHPSSPKCAIMDISHPGLPSCSICQRPPVHDLIAPSRSGREHYSAIRGTHTMARTTSAPRKRPIETYEHTDKQRANNPPGGAVTPETRRPLTPVLYYRG